MVPKTDRAAEPEGLPLGLVWVDCSYPVVALGLEKALVAKARVHRGGRPLVGILPSCVVCCPEGGEHEVSLEVERVKKAAPGAAILVFGLSPDLKLARAAVRAGARGFLHAGMPPEQLARAVEIAVAGEIVAPRRLLEGFFEGERGSNLSGLRPRQREVLELVADGLSNAEIARQLYISESTVKQHLRAAYKILNVSNRAEAASLFRRSS